MSAPEPIAAPRARPASPPTPTRVTELRRRLATGGYEVRPELVAEAMLRAGVFARPGGRR